MAQLRFETLTIPGAEVGPDNPLPPLGRDARRPPDPTKYRGFSADMLQQMGYGHPPNYLPYTMQDRYTRQRRPLDTAIAVLESPVLRAEFLLEWGGRLRSLIHKPSGRELLHCNPVLQPANLAVRNAWFSGGTEWNIGMLGHHPLTCSPLFAARATAPDGSGTCLRMWEWERLRQVPYQIDAWIDEDLPVLLVRVRIDNPHDRDVPMYWWSNTAVPESEDVRVLVPAPTAYNFGYGEGGPARVDMPVVQGVDVSYVTNAPRAADFFYHVPVEEGQRPWVAALDGEGRGLVQTSTDRLKGRKLFFWGMGDGGRRWQTWLSEPGQRYLEIQAGLARTQMQHLPMPAGACWTWLEAYGMLEADAACVHGDDWTAARDEAEARLEALVPRSRLTALHEAAAAVCQRPPLEVVQQGSGWGALERMLREHDGMPAFAGAATPFGTESLGAAQAPWRKLLETGELPPADPDAEPVSYLVQREWRQRLETSLARTTKADWSAWYQLGVMRYAASDPAGARQAWEHSLAAIPTPWVHRCLAVLCAEEDDASGAASHYREACTLGGDMLPVLLEAGKFLVEHGAAADWLDIVDGLSAPQRQAGRVRLLEAQAAVAEGDFSRAEAILLDRGLTIDDLREGERSLSHLWFELHEGRSAQEEGIPVDDVLKKRVRAAHPLPAHLDFRMS